MGDTPFLDDEFFDFFEPKPPSNPSMATSLKNIITGGIGSRIT